MEGFVKALNEASVEELLKEISDFTQQQPQQQQQLPPPQPQMFYPSPTSSPLVTPPYFSETDCVYNSNDWSFLPSPPLSTSSDSNIRIISQKRSRKQVPYAANMLNLQLQDDRIKKQTKPRSGSTTRTANYTCDVEGCNKMFTRPYNLKSHKRTHTAERPFACPLCPKRFARQHDQNRHTLLHTGVKAFTCPVCFKSFARQDALSRHIRPLGSSDSSNSGPVCTRNRRRRRSPKRSTKD